MLEGELAGDEVQDEAEVSRRSTIGTDDRSENPTAVPVRVEFRFNGFPLGRWGAV